MVRRLEEQLMIYCSTTHIDEKRIEQVQEILSEELDWNYILASRAFSVVIPLLFYNLRMIAGRDTVPSFVVDKLRTGYIEILRNNTWLYRQLCDILAELKSEGIPVILLKGSALAKTVYPDIALRPMSDIDILVEEANLPATTSILSELGYVPICHDEVFYGGHHHIVPYKRHDKDRGISAVIEIHRNIVPEPLMSKIDINCLWANPQALNVEGIDVLALSAENLILHLCLHLSSAGFVGGIKYLVDISETVKHYNEQLDWNSFVMRINEFGLGNSVYYPLWVTREMMDADIPADVLSELNLVPKLHDFETKLLKAIIRRSAFRVDLHESSSHFVTIAYESLCRELLCTPGLRKRVSNIIGDGLYALRKAYYEYIKKDYTLRPTRWRKVGRRGNHN